MAWAARLLLASDEEGPVTLTREQRLEILRRLEKQEAEIEELRSKLKERERELSERARELSER